MSDELTEALGIDMNDPAQQRAQHLVEQDGQLLSALREVRLARGLSVEDVAALLGVEAERIRSIERYDADPTLSQLRRYAHAVGALVSHDVVADQHGV